MAFGIASVDPLNYAEGQPLATKISVTFTEAIDIDSVHEGSFILATRAKNVLHSGPAFHSVIDSVQISYNPLKSSEFQGLIEGKYDFSEDYKTVTFSPFNILSHNTEFVAILSTDITTRTIGEIETGYYEDNTGTGNFWLEGPYTGDTSNVIVIQITKGGLTGAAQFKWSYLSSIDSWSADINCAYTLPFVDGLVLHFQEGIWEEGDTFYFSVSPGEHLPSIYSWSFATGSESFVEPPSEQKSIQLQGLNVISSSNGLLTLLEKMPDNDTPTINDWNSFTLTFSEAIKAEQQISVYTKNIQSYMAKDRTKTSISFSYTVNGPNLFITLDLSSLENEVLPDNSELVFDLLIESVSGAKHISKLIYLTELTPLYVDADRIMLEAGEWLNSIPPSTIYRMLWNNSQDADQINYKKIQPNDEIYAQYLFLKATYVLNKTLCQVLRLSAGEGPSSFKRLGDLSVTGRKTPQEKLNYLASSCNKAEELEEMLQNGGIKHLAGIPFIKSVNDPNSYKVGRGWDSLVELGELPAGNVRNVYYRRGYTTGLNGKNHEPRLPYNE